MRPADTTPEAWRALIESQRRMPPGEKLKRTLQLSESLLSAAAAGFRRRYPDASEREIFLRVARRRLGRDLFRRVYGDELKTDGPT